MRPVSVWLALGLLLAGYLTASLTAVGCSENVFPGTAREDACNVVADGTSAWIAVAWPAAVFMATQLAPLLRRHPFATAAVVALAGAAFWLPFMLIVSGNWR